MNWLRLTRLCRKRRVADCIVRLCVWMALVALSVGSAGCRTDYGPSFTFVQLADPQLGMGGYKHDVDTFSRAVKTINRINPDFVIICGDMVNTPNDRSVADFKAIAAQLTMPCRVAPGNHDVGNTPTEASLARYRKLFGDDRYVFEHKGVVFIVTNSQLWQTSQAREQMRWLEDTLRNARSRHLPVIMVTHIPLYKRNDDEEDDYYNIPRSQRRVLLSLLRTHNVLAVLSGHTHSTRCNTDHGIEMVSGGSTSNTSDKIPLGFWLWRIERKKPVEHHYVTLDE